MAKEKAASVAVLGQHVKIRKEGNEYLLYNRKTDGLYILKRDALDTLTSVNQLGSLKKAATALSKNKKISIEEAKAYVMDVVGVAQSQGLLSDRFTQSMGVEMREIPQGIKPQFESLTHLGDLTVSAWAISALTKNVR